MRNVVIVFMFAMAVTAMAGYLMVSFSPFNTDAVNTLVTQDGLETRSELVTKLESLAGEGKVVNYLNMNNVALLVGTAGVAITTWFFAGQLLWLTLRRKLYQNLNIAPSLRRSAWLLLAFILTIYFRIYNVSLWVLLGALVLIVAIEYLVTKATQKINLAQAKTESSKQPVQSKVHAKINHV